MNKDLIEQKKLDKEFSRLTVSSIPITATELIDSINKEADEKDRKDFGKEKNSKKLSYYEVGDYVKLKSYKNNSNLIGTEFRISATIGREFLSIGNSNAIYLHGVRKSEVVPSRNKVKFYMRRAYRFIYNLFL